MGRTWARSGLSNRPTSWRTSLREKHHISGERLGSGGVSKRHHRARALNPSAARQPAGNGAAACRFVASLSFASRKPAAGGELFPYPRFKSPPFGSSCSYDQDD
ncbi:hypothetical protein GUJ93_ZPchr0009g2323 [Zizania palustris]|uniref:Uncharacterized protein n=1 Tax=Zizania palustris TaxID=103762 RepID=A0A8J5RAD0_ZIZPA|nr:hypothetical protein GUJ93_ZPchr0009g2323 [Zizania palustris]